MSCCRRISEPPSITNRFRRVLDRPCPELLRTPCGPPGTLSCTVVKGAKYPVGTKRKAAGEVRTQFPGGAGERVGNGLLAASGWEKSTVTLVSKAAFDVPGAGDTDVMVNGGGGGRIVVG